MILLALEPLIILQTTNWKNTVIYFEKSIFRKYLKIS